MQPIREEELKRLHEHVERYFTAAPAKDKGLDTARRVIEAIWDEHAATEHGDAIAARSALSRALNLQPNNMYLRFLDRQQRATAKQASLVAR